jgi:hypothetical protein
VMFFIENGVHDCSVLPSLLQEAAPGGPQQASNALDLANSDQTPLPP